MDQLSLLLVRLAENWDCFQVFDWQPDVPRINDQTEQALGRMKMRARTARGYKTWSGMQNGLFLTGTGLARSSSESRADRAYWQFPKFTNRLWNEHMEKRLLRGN